MKKSELVKVIREELQGYSKYLGKTKGGTPDEFMQILTRIAKGTEKGDADRGNKILDKANPDNVARIIRGENPIYEETSNGIGIMVDELTADKLKEIFPKFGEKYGNVYFPTGGDVLVSVSNENALEQWKNDTKTKYGNVEIIFHPQKSGWSEKVEINNPEFIADKEASTGRKERWLSGERKAGRTGGLD
jgi:hypothetical protein